MKVGNFISDIQTMLKLDTSDSFVSPEAIHSEAKSIISDYIKKDHEAKRKLQKVSEGWSELNCIDLEEVDVIPCADIDIRICDKIMKSVKKIPDTFTYSFGNIIKHVASINFSIILTPTTPQGWANIQKRKFKDKSILYYFFIGGYLYIPIPKGQDFGIEKLRMETYFLDKQDVDKFNNRECSDCKDNCFSALDYELVCPEYMIDAVKLALYERFSKLYLRLRRDDYPNLNQDISGQRDLQNSANGLS